MKVLIIGEYSAFAKNLCAGINSIKGNHAIVFAYKDGFKSIDQSEDSHTYETPRRLSIFGISVPLTQKITGWFLYRQFKKDVLKYKGYFDTVFIINSQFIRLENDFSSPLFSINDIRYVTKASSKIFLSACGGDSIYYRFATTDKRISTTFTTKNSIIAPKVKKAENILFSVVDGVIPMSYQYAQAYRLYAKDIHLLPSIHLPFDTNTIPKRTKYLEGGKVVIFNAALRPKKGITYINEALDIIKKKYSDRIIIKDVRLPYNEYLEFLPTVDLFIDLCVDYDYGMSAITAMAAGCVVFSGNERETRQELNIDNVPVVGISPSTNDIVEKLEFYILHPGEIEKRGRESIEYAFKHHNCSYIAGKYLDAFNK